MILDPKRPTHFVLMRTDLPSYQAGKSMAQSNHAGTAMVVDALMKEHPYRKQFLTWLNEGGGGFGTCIVKGVTHRQLLKHLEQAHHLGLIAGPVVDLEYPIQDGHTVTYAKVTTCGYIFGPRDRCDLAVGELPLFRDDNDG